MSQGGKDTGISLIGKLRYISEHDNAVKLGYNDNS